MLSLRSCHRWWFCLILIWSVAVVAFNIEDRIPLVKVGPKHSLFGLSVAQHHTTNTARNMNEIMFLVGAPKAVPDETASLNSTGSGALYKCNVLSNSRDCQQVIINQVASSLTRDSSKQWLGVTVQSQKPGGKVAVCAHRYTRRGSNPDRGVIWEELQGRCYQLNSLDESGVVGSPEILDPCDGIDRSSTHSHETYAYCQAGTSLAYAKNIEEDIVIGTPGIFHWTGGIATYKLNPDDPFNDGTFWSQNELGGPIQKNSYSGFSTVFGNISDFNLVTGAPRANDTGAVIIYGKTLDKSIAIKEIVSGEKIASAFGYDLKVFDITGDGRDDLIVGAPQYYDREKKVGGAVYIYVNKGHSFGNKYTSVLFGKVDSTFGNSVTNLGDINMDGVNDLAVGAPGDDDGVGRVYIFHGHSDPNRGVDQNPSQIIKGTELNSTSNIQVTGFGYSLSGSLDMDLNGYPDLTVGSLSDMAFLYRTRPIVNIQANLNPSDAKIDINSTTSKSNLVDYYDPVKNTTIKLVTFTVSVCLQYKSYPETFDAPVKLMYTLTLDSEKVQQKLRSRAMFVKKNYSEHSKIVNITLAKQSSNRADCANHTVYLDNEMQDKLSPFVLTLKYELITEVPPNRKRGKLVSLAKYPILNKSRPNTVANQVNISKNCGEDEICHSNLSVKAEYVVLLSENESWKPLEHNAQGIPVLMIGTEKGFGVRANISNPSPGEDAHQAKFKLLLPSFLTYSGIEPKTVTCKTNPDNSSILECSLGNPFRTNRKISLVVKLEFDKVLNGINSFVTSTTVSTSSVQNEPSFLAHQVLVRKQVALKIDGYASKDQIPFGGKVIGESAVKSPQLAGLPVTHNYEIKNIGTTQVNDIHVTIDWPFAITNEKWLFYLLSVKTSASDNGTVCVVPPGFSDPLHLVEKQRKRLKREVKVGEQPSQVKKSNSGDSSELSPTLSCPLTAKCVRINCTLSSISRSKSVFINVEGVVWNSTFLEEYNDTALVIVFSNASVEVSQSNVEYSDTSERHAKVQTTMRSEIIVPADQPIELWIIVIACLGGVVLLVMIVLLLWKCGFFKRNRDFGESYHKARKHRQASKKADEVSDRLVY